MSAEERRASWSARRGTGVAAAATALLFALVSAYWGLGGELGLDTLGGAVESRARAGDAALAAANWAAVVLKVLGAGLALALVQAWGRRLPRRLVLVAGWGGALLLTAYGALQTSAALLIHLGVIEPAVAVPERVLLWRLLLWEPWFLVWGLLLTATLRGVGSAGSRHRPSPPPTSL